MRKLLVMSVLLLGTAWVAAQTSPSSSSDQSSSTSSQSSTQATSGASGSQTVEGCLSGSNGNFTLTDKSGTSYQLAGDTSKLSDHVGQDVQITGSSSQNSSASAPSSSSGASAASSGASAQQTLNVSSVTKVSDTCSNSGSSGTPR